MPRTTSGTPPDSPATDMISRVLTGALIAGFAAGLIAAALQLVFVQPVLLHAELYETGQLVHFGADPAVSAAQDTGRFDAGRDLLSVMFSAVVYVGYALILAAAMVVASDRGWVRGIDARSGILWGLAGFITFHLAPGFGLPPELPGVAAADLGARQVWWWGTVAATGLAMGLIGFGRNWLAWAPAIVLLALPHLIGAPEPAVFTGPVPPELGGAFAARAFGVGMAAWVTLGAIAGFVWQRDSLADGRPAIA